MNISSERLKEQIYEMAVNDSHDALKCIYMAYYSKLLNLAIYYVKSKPAAEEIVSDTFQAVWEQRAKLLEIHNFNAYICQIAKNISINYIRKNSGKTMYIDNIDVHTYSDANENPETKMISSELMEKLNQCIESLPDRCKLVFKLIREENLKYKDVAQMLNVSTKTIEAHMSLAIKKLRSTIEKK